MTALAILAAYLLGSFPTGYVVTRLVSGTDIRAVGSGATGATNTLRTLGWRWGVVVMLVDLLKGVGAVLLAHGLDAGDLGVALAAVAAVAGHCWSVWLGFKGGKGVATGAGAAFALCPWALVLIPILALPIVATRYVSLGSITAALSAPLLFVLFGALDLTQDIYIVYAVVAASVVIYKHRDNIARLRAGTERRIGGAKTAPGA